MVTERRPTRRPKAAPSGKKRRPFDALAYLLDMSQRLPAEEVARMPRDLAYNFDHYHDGTPKQR